MIIVIIVSTGTCLLYNYSTGSNPWTYIVRHNRGDIIKKLHIHVDRVHKDSHGLPKDYTSHNRNPIATLDLITLFSGSSRTFPYYSQARQAHDS